MHLLCIRWYLPYQLSYRNLEEMMRERGLAVNLHGAVGKCQPEVVGQQAIHGFHVSLFISIEPFAFQLSDFPVGGA